MQRKATKMKKTTRKELALLIKFFLEGTDYGKGVTGIQLKLILDNVHKDQNIYVMLDMDAYLVRP